MENVQKNQIFRSYDALVVILAAVALLIVAVPVVGRQIDAKNSEIARNEANRLAEHLAAVQMDAGQDSPKASTRQVASADSPLDRELKSVTEKLDPWGRPYQANFVRNTYGQIIAIAVWSLGPNAQNETDDLMLRRLVSKGDSQFGGDDVGVIILHQ